MNWRKVSNNSKWETINNVIVSETAEKTISTLIKPDMKARPLLIPQSNTRMRLYVNNFYNKWVT